MLKVGITGGIGAGKSTVCALFEVLGIPVLYADDIAKALMETDQTLVSGIKALGGDALYNNGVLDRKSLATLVFGNEAKLLQLNALVHPATIRYAVEWMSSRDAPYSLKEAALFFEVGSEKEMDKMIGISAPLELRIERVIMRSELSRAEVLSRISRQMNEEEKMRRCDFVILNDDVTALVPQVLELHRTLISTVR